MIVALTGRFDPGPGTAQVLAAPVWQAPVWSTQAMIELVVPLAITVLVVQNGQGVAVLRAARHEAADQRRHHRLRRLVAAGGDRRGRLHAASPGRPTRCSPRRANARATTPPGICCGLLAIGFGLFAPVFTRLMLAAPAAFIAALAGLAMLRVLQAAFVTAFRTRFTLGALVTFVVTIADVSRAQHRRRVLGPGGRAGRLAAAGTP